MREGESESNNGRVRYRSNSRLIAASSVVKVALKNANVEAERGDLCPHLAVELGHFSLLRQVYINLVDRCPTLGSGAAHPTRSHFADTSIPSRPLPVAQGRCRNKLPGLTNLRSALSLASSPSGGPPFSLPLCATSSAHNAVEGNVGASPPSPRGVPFHDYQARHPSFSAAPALTLHIHTTLQLINSHKSRRATR